MYRRLCSILAAGVLLLLPTVLTSAQEKAVGAALSYHETSLTYEHPLTPDSWLKVGVNVDWTGVMAGKAPFPGGSAAIGYTVAFAGKAMNGGERLRGIAGPGIKVGWVRNEEFRYGLMAALSGTVGLEYVFRVPVSLQLTLEPTIGLHVNRDEDDHLRMDFYLPGLFFSVMPHIGIRYRF